MSANDQAFFVEKTAAVKETNVLKRIVLSCSPLATCGGWKW